MDEWTVVSVITSIVGLFIAVGKPIISLNNNIALLNANIKHNSDELAKQKKELEAQRLNSHESHQRLWDKNEEQDKKINEHETRLQVLENK